MSSKRVFEKMTTKQIIPMEGRGISASRHVICLLIVFLAAAAFRYSWFQGNEASLTGDEPEYHLLAQRLSAGQGFTLESGEPTAWRTPGFPLILAAIYRAGGDVASARSIFTVISCLTAVLIYCLSYLLFGQMLAAFLSGLCWAPLLNSIRMAGSLMGEASAAFLLTGVFCMFLLAERRRSAALFAASGLLLGFAVLVRGYLLFAIPLLALWGLWRKLGIRSVAVFFSTSCLVLGIWIVRNRMMMGAFTISTESAQTIWCGNNQWARGSWPGEWAQADSRQRQYLQSRHPEFDAAGELERAAIFRDEALQEIRHHPFRALRLLPRKALIYFSPVSYLGLDWMYAACGFFGLIGLGMLLKQPSTRAIGWLLLTPVVAVLMICMLTFGDPRFRHPVDPMIVTAAGFGVSVPRGRSRIGNS